MIISNKYLFHNITRFSYNLTSRTLLITPQSFKITYQIIKITPCPNHYFLLSKTEDHENGGDDVSEKSTSEHDSAGHRSEQDFYERHGTAYFSSDEDEAEGDDDSDEDGLTAKVGLS